MSKESLSEELEEQISSEERKKRKVQEEKEEKIKQEQFEKDASGFIIPTFGSDISNYQGGKELSYSNDDGATSRGTKYLVHGRDYWKKQIQPKYKDNPKYELLFRKEFEIGNLLHHVAFPKYWAYGEDENGPYFIMDYIEGWTLNALKRDCPHFFENKRRTDRFISQLLDGVEYLHTQDVVHCDLKPANVMITRRTLMVKILDLGFCSCGAYDERLRGATKQYAAPEQLNDKDLDSRTDIYLIGNLIKAALGDASGKISDEVYAVVVDKCLQPNPDYRFQDVSEIKEFIFKSQL